MNPSTVTVADAATTAPASAPAAVPAPTVSAPPAIVAFASKVSVDVAALAARLLEVAVSDFSPASLAILANEDLFSRADWVSVCASLGQRRAPVVAAALSDFRAEVVPAPVKAAPPAAAPVAPAPAPVVAMPESLSKIFSSSYGDEDLLRGLSGEVTPQVSSAEVIAALRVASAANLGLFGAMSKIRQFVEAELESRGTPATPDVIEIFQEVESERYAEAARALGLRGASISDANASKMTTRITTILVPAVSAFAETAVAISRTAADLQGPTALALLARSLSPATASMPLPMMTQAPDLQPLRDAAERVVEAANATFAGLTARDNVRRMVARATTVNGWINNRHELWAAAGVSSRDELLKKVGISIPADERRRSSTMAKVAALAMELPRLSDTEILTAVSMILADVTTLTVSPSRSTTTTGTSIPKRFSAMP